MSAHFLLAPLLFAAVGGTHLAEPLGYARPPRHSHSITVRVAPPAKGVKLPPIYGPTDPSRPLVVIDAGHGGHDPGAASRGGERQEKELTLALALALRDRLVRGGRIRVALTRGDDQFLLLQERYDIARRLGADLFLSIHADAAENDTAQGATIYTLSETASDREAARLAARENRSDIINGVDLGAQGGVVNSILIDLSQREAMAQSVAFAELLYREAAAHTPFRSNWHRFASLVVLKAPDVPSILFEAGYITSPQDVARLSSAQGRAQTAEGVARAIEIYFARRVNPR